MFLNKRKKRDEPEDMAILPDDVKKKDRQEEGIEDSEDALVSQIGNLEELVNKRARDLEEAREQLKNLYHTPDTTEVKDTVDAAEQLLIKPNQPEIASMETADVKIEVPPGEEKAEAVAEEDKEKAAESLLEKPNDDASASSGEGRTEGDSDDYFSDIEEEENSLAGLIAGFPEVSADELLADAEEVKKLVQEWMPR